MTQHVFNGADNLSVLLDCSLPKTTVTGGEEEERQLTLTLF